jgi:hypothetical protein
MNAMNSSSVPLHGKSSTEQSTGDVTSNSVNTAAFRADGRAR